MVLVYSPLRPGTSTSSSASSSSGSSCCCLWTGSWIGITSARCRRTTPKLRISRSSYLLNLGHRHIVSHRGCSRTSATMGTRFEGYARGLKDFLWLPLRDDLVLAGETTFETVYVYTQSSWRVSRAARRSLPPIDFDGVSRPGRPQRIWGWRVPEDLSIIGYDEIPFSALLLASSSLCSRASRWGGYVLTLLYPFDRGGGFLPRSGCCCGIASLSAGPARRFRADEPRPLSRCSGARSTEMMLAVDLGTTNCKVLILDAACRILESARLEYPIFDALDPDWSEQDPETWWSAVSQAIRMVASRAGAKRASGPIGLSGQMHGLVALDGRGKVLRPAILWNDQRSESQCREIYAAVGGKQALAALTNNAMLPGYVGGKLPLVPGARAGDLRPDPGPSYCPRTTSCTGCAESVARICRMRPAPGSSTSDGGPWSTELVDRPEASRARGSPHASSRSRWPGGYCRPWRRSSGCVRGSRWSPAVETPSMQTVGAGVLTQERFAGGDWHRRQRDDHRPRSCPSLPGPNTQVFCHVIPEAWVALGVTLNAGNALKWYRDLSAEEASFSGAGRWNGRYGRRTRSLPGPPHREPAGWYFCPTCRVSGVLMATRMLADA